LADPIARVPLPEAAPRPKDLPGLIREKPAQIRRFAQDEEFFGSRLAVPPVLPEQTPYPHFPIAIRPRNCYVSLLFKFASASLLFNSTKVFVARRHRRQSHDLPTNGFRRSPGRSMQSHREWLLERHGSVCAYCGSETSPDVITLDHVRPRRGQTAYDRPDNLVLACRECNAAKADMPLVAFLMQKRARGVFLLHYGDHLSEPLKALAKQASERPMLAKEL